MTKKAKKRLIRILAGAAAFAAACIVSEYVKVSANIELLLFLFAYLVTGGDVLKKAARNIISGEIFDENFLMVVATVGAFLIAEYPEAVAVMLFYQVGEFFQAYAVNKSRTSIKELMDICPEYANVIRDGREEQVEPDEVLVGEVIVMKPGEKIPLDGVVLEGQSSLDTKALTGESIPREVGEGDTVVSGCVNQSGVLKIQVTKEFGESTVAKILDLVENAGNKKAEAENFITKFSRYYTPGVVLAAALLAIIPSLITGEWSVWVYRALTFLVISCPCALVISIPLSFFGGIGGASRQGILVKGGNYLEAVAKAGIMAFDKTGTLTKGSFEVQDIVPVLGTKEELLEKTAYAEAFSNHPISQSLKKAYGKELDKARVTEVKEIAGHGIQAKVDKELIYAGNEKLMKQLSIEAIKPSEIGTCVHVAYEGKYAGYILIADEVKKDAQKAVSSLKKLGVSRLVMLTGDTKETGEKVAEQLGLTEVHTELLPTDKVEKVEQMLREKQEKEVLCFVGDGMNDAPVLARADVGIAMGGLGSDAAIEAADIVIMTDEPSKIAAAIAIARKTLRIVKQNIWFALGVKFFVLVLAALGYAPMWAAVFADVGVAVIAILNAMRALKPPVME